MYSGKNEPIKELLPGRVLDSLNGHKIRQRIIGEEWAYYFACKVDEGISVYVFKFLGVYVFRFQRSR